MRYDQNVKNWVFPNGDASVKTESGLYWNSTAGADYSFSSLTTAGATTTEDAKNQFLFVDNNVSQIAFDMDTGTIRAKGDVIAMNDLIGYSTSDSGIKKTLKKLVMLSKRLTVFVV